MTTMDIDRTTRADSATILVVNAIGSVRERTGHEPYSTLVRRHTSKAGWLNLAFIPYGLVGLGVDLAGGGMYELSTWQLAMRLVADSAASSSGEGGCAPDEHASEPRTSPGDTPHLMPCKSESAGSSRKRRRSEGACLYNGRSRPP